jgi:hypothetical protein
MYAMTKKMGGIAPHFDHLMQDWTSTRVGFAGR